MKESFAGEWTISTISFVFKSVNVQWDFRFTFLCYIHIDFDANSNISIIIPKNAGNDNGYLWKMNWNYRSTDIKSLAEFIPLAIRLAFDWQLPTLKWSHAFPSNKVIGIPNIVATDAKGRALLFAPVLTSIIVNYIIHL